MANFQPSQYAQALFGNRRRYIPAFQTGHDDQLELQRFSIFSGCYSIVNTETRNINVSLTEIARIDTDFVKAFCHS